MSALVSSLRQIVMNSPLLKLPGSNILRYAPLHLKLYSYMQIEVFNQKDDFINKVSEVGVNKVLLENALVKK